MEQISKKRRTFKNIMCVHKRINAVYRNRYNCPSELSISFFTTHLNPILSSVSTASDPTALDAKHWGQNTGHEGQLLEIITQTFLQHPSCWWTYNDSIHVQRNRTKNPHKCLWLSGHVYCVTAQIYPVQQSNSLPNTLNQQHDLQL